MWVIIFGTILVILFIIWQFKAIMKYAFKYDNLKIDAEHGFLTINNEKIKFVDINYITVEELEQPSMAEKIFTRGGRYAYISDIIIYLKDGVIKKCTLNSKGRLYKTLKMLQPYVKVVANVDSLNEGLPNWITILLLIIGTVWIIRFFILNLG